MYSISSDSVNLISTNYFVNNCCNDHHDNENEQNNCNQDCHCTCCSGSVIAEIVTEIKSTNTFSIELNNSFYNISYASFIPKMKPKPPKVEVIY